MGRPEEPNGKKRVVSFRVTLDVGKRLDTCAERASARANVEIGGSQWAASAIVREIERDEAAARKSSKRTRDPA
jgi:hypothetical protein